MLAMTGRPVKLSDMAWRLLLLPGDSRPALEVWQPWGGPQSSGKGLRQNKAPHSLDFPFAAGSVHDHHNNHHPRATPQLVDSPGCEGQAALSGSTYVQSPHTGRGPGFITPGKELFVESCGYQSSKAACDK